MNKPTDKTHCIITSFGSKIFITEQQYLRIFNNFDQMESVKITEIGIINKKHIVFVGKASEIIKSEREKKGEWKCDYGKWHQKFQECGCKELAKYKKYETNISKTKR